MYQCQLDVNLIRCSEEMAETLSKDIFPLPRFTYKINKISELTTQPPTSPENFLLIVCPVKIAEGKLTRLEHLDDNQRLVVLADDPSAISSELLALADEIWPLTLTKKLIIFYFSKFVQKLKVEKDAWLNKNYLDTTINMLPDLVWFKDLSGCHLDVNDAFADAVDKPKSDIRGHYHHYIWGLTEEEYQEGAFVCLETEEKVLRARKTCVFEEEVLHAKRGLRELLTWKTPVFDENRKIIGTIGIGRDITDEKENQTKILQMANTDPLTGLFNRRYFYEKVNAERAERPITIFYIDLDHFKELNDTFGHQSGDAALLGIAELMRLVFVDDVVSRLGGDEFVIAHFGALTRNEAADLLEVLRRNAKEFFQMDECMQNLSMSIGVAMADDPGVSLDNLLLRSDVALYNSKENGRDRYTFFEDVDKAELNKRV